MIIFTPIKDLPYEYLERKNIRQVVKYNLSSYYADIPTLVGLVPNPEFMSEDAIRTNEVDPRFDIEFHQYIMNNPQSFDQFMNIVLPVYMNPDTLVQVLISESNYRDAITESIIKLIQARYGYNSYIIHDIEDFLYAEESTFSIPGLFSMDQDLQRWHMMHIGEIESMEEAYE